LWILIFDNIFLELREGQRGRVGRGERRARVLGEELVNDFGEQLVCYKGGIVLVADYDACDALGTAIGVEGVC